MTSPSLPVQRALAELAAYIDAGQWPTPNALHYAITTILIDCPRGVFDSYVTTLRQVPELAEVCRRFNAEAALRAQSRSSNEPPPVAGELRVVDSGDT